MSSIEKATNMLDNAFARANESLPEKVVNTLASNDASGEVGEKTTASAFAKNPAEQKASECIKERSDSAKRSAKLVLPVEKFKALGMITTDDIRSVVAEEYRAIKRPVLHFIDEVDEDVDRANTVMVASCVSGEGKTYSAINLAMSIALEPDRNVLMIDADVAKASASDLMGSDPKAKGLIDLLIDDSLDINDVIQDTDMERLQFLPVGSASELSTELLASDRMEKILNQLSSNQTDQVIVIDSAPILLTNEANVLAQRVGQVVFVIAAENTSQQMVVEGLGRFNSGVKVGLILNKVRKTFGRGYGYGYGYGYQVANNRVRNVHTR